ncbi:hypothetical protein ACVCGZ_16420, partial [Serratia nematodiphila]
DIRINSPPFYRLNYRGIVGTGRIIAGRPGFVKALNCKKSAFAEGMNTLRCFSAFSIAVR